MSEQKYLRKVETPLMYKECTLKYIDSIPNSQIDWIKAIFSKEKETEKVLFRNDQFVVVTDEFDNKNKDDLHVLALTCDPSLRSIRDLRGEKHLSLLRNIRKAGYKALEENFSLKSECVFAYINYLPSFYRFHVHFRPVSTAKKAMHLHILEDAIFALKTNSSHYRYSNLSLFLGEKRHQSLLESFQKTDCIEDGHKCDF
ncbi:hypothetical protein MHBO_000318 [Bonamia ostreae]|uniref:Uncharacterized protein n=1 Tax=Bonamia ostreae TaxID=126728 RepID=A0ABV2AG24_9EUKA